MKNIDRFLDKNGNINKNIKRLLTAEDCKFFNIDLSKNISEQLYCYMHDIDVNVLCPVCKVNRLKFKTYSSGYQSACSISCSMKTEEYQQKMLQSYGAVTNFKRDDIKLKVRQTNLEKYGFENPAQSEIVRNKIEQTNLERYGYKSSLSNADVKQKIKRTIQNKYNEDYASSNDNVRNKISQSLKKTYSLNGNEIKTKIRDTTLDKFGVEHISQSDEFKSNLVLRNHTKAFNRLNNLTNVRALFDLSEYENCSSLHSYQCLVCNTIFQDHIDDGSEPRCTHCHPKTISTLQLKVQNYLTCLNICYLINDRTILNGKELDILIPDKNIAIEINGFYWHMNDLRHIDKINQCAAKNIILLNIDEEEILYNWEYVKIMINLFLFPCVSANDNLNDIITFDIYDDTMYNIKFKQPALPQLNILRDRCTYIVIDNEYNWVNNLLEKCEIIYPMAWSIKTKSKQPFTKGDCYFDCGKTVYTL